LKQRVLIKKIDNLVGTTWLIRPLSFKNFAIRPLFI